MSTIFLSLNNIVLVLETCCKGLGTLKQEVIFKGLGIMANLVYFYIFIQMTVNEQGLKWPPKITSSFYCSFWFSLYKHICEGFFILMPQYDIIKLIFFSLFFSILNVKRFDFKQSFFYKTLSACFNKVFSSAMFLLRQFFPCSRSLCVLYLKRWGNVNFWLIS